MPLPGDWDGADSRRSRVTGLPSAADGGGFTKMWPPEPAKTVETRVVGQSAEAWRMVGDAKVVRWDGNRLADITAFED